MTVRNTEKRISFQAGKWSAVHACISTLKDEGKLLLYETPKRGQPFAQRHSMICPCPATWPWNQHGEILGIDGKHGLQDDLATNE